MKVAWLLNILLLISLHSRSNDLLPGKLYRWNDLQEQHRGQSKRVLDGSTSTLAKLAVTVAIIGHSDKKKLKQIPAGEEELIIITEGRRATISINNKTKTTGKGSIAVMTAQFEMHTTALNAAEVSQLLHTRIQEEIVVILTGDVAMHSGGELFPASPGDLIFLPPVVAHALHNAGQDQCEYFAFQWRN